MSTETHRIGILGGSFDPLHNGHLLIAQAAADTFDLETVLFLPNPNPPHKRGRAVLPGEIRSRMIAAAIAPYPRFSLSEYELKRDGICYTCETLAYFRSRFPEQVLYFIMGADSLRDLPTWRHPEEIAHLSVLCVACRDDLHAQSLNELAERMRVRYDADIRLITCGGMDVSSSRIRRMVRAGEDISSLVPKEVARMISEYSLYRA